MTEDFRRKLAAVLCADVAGYTRLMAGDESATHAAYKSCLNDVVLPAIEARRGRIVKSTGDGFIAIFDSAVDGLACALEIQDGIAAKGEGLRIAFRIGVNVGDIIVEDNDVFGDGVNIAARLQALAEPGGVCVSALLRDQIGAKLPVEYVSQGRRRVKKGETPLNVYAVHARAGLFRRGPAARLAMRVRPVLRRKRVIALAAATICAMAFGLWQSDLAPVWPGASLVTGLQAPRYPLPDRPSLVVLPFKMIGPGQGQDYFADGITEDVITDLAQVRGLFVISRTSSFAYKSRTEDVRRIGRELGVRYALEGSVRRSTDEVRIDAQLIDAETGGHVWAARFDRPLGDIFKIQDEITGKIVDALSIKITEREGAGRDGAHTASFAAYDAYLRGWAAYRRNTYEDYQKALEDFRAAVAIDPGFSQAHAAIAATYLAARIYSWPKGAPVPAASPVQAIANAHRNDLDLLQKAREHVEAALRTPTSLAYRSSAEILLFEGKHDAAIRQIRKAIALDENDADNFALLAAALVWAGKPDAAIEPIERAMRLNPYHPPVYFCYYGIALFSRERYDEAARQFERCKAGNPANQWPYIYLISTYSYLNQDARAEAARRQLGEILSRQGRGPFTVKEARNHLPYRYRADLMRMLVGLHKAGVADSYVQGE